MNWAPELLVGSQSVIVVSTSFFWNLDKLPVLVSAVDSFSTGLVAGFFSQPMAINANAATTNIERFISTPLEGEGINLCVS